MINLLSKLPGARRFLNRLPNLPVSARVDHDMWWNAPSYGYGTQSAARLAKALSVPRITAMEWGVVQGDNLVQLEHIAAIIGRHFDVGVDVAAFDTGKGLPSPVDHRDCPHIWDKGFYTIDAPKVRQRLSYAKLVLGDVGSSLHEFLSGDVVAPVGFVACNLDYYSLARDALDALVSTPPAKRLPRIVMLFDDVLYPERAAHNEWMGERLAINEFNAAHAHMKVAPIRGLRWMRSSPAYWHEMVYVLHDFSHPQYKTLITPEGYQHRQM